jgi:hypothetical protein
MKKIQIVRLSLLFIIIVLFLTSCKFQSPISAPKRSFTASELILTQTDLPISWFAPYGSKKDTDSGKPANSMNIDIYHFIVSDRADISEFVSIHKTTQQAKNAFNDSAQFPGQGDNSWSFTSEIADEEKISCYTYSNQNFPICTWLGRYKEITIEVIGRLKPGSVSLSELQTIVMIIDQKVSRQFEN